MQQSFVEALARTDRRLLEHVRIVGDERDARFLRLAVDRDPQRLAMPQ